ncbi:MAG: hypothetical protein ACRDTT_16505, partial [Pseudonocardiaceae bacterium]
IVGQAEQRAAELDAESATQRRQVEEDFDITMSARRSETMHTLAEQEATSRSEAGAASTRPPKPPGSDRGRSQRRGHGRRSHPAGRGAAHGAAPGHRATAGGAHWRRGPAPTRGS